MEDGQASSQQDIIHHPAVIHLQEDTLQQAVFPIQDQVSTEVLMVVVTTEVITDLNLNINMLINNHSIFNCS